jgi:YidC/Oxa1 family membrane protein insertase
MWDTLILNPMMNSLLWIYDLLANNFGLAIIVFTIVVRLITYPLTAQQMKSTQKMQEMQKSKEWQEIQTKHKGDREKLASEQMRLYREMGVSPFGSCLPTIIQFPIIIGLYQSIMRALATTPSQLLNFTTHVYPFLNAAALIPLNNQFLWMDLSLPEKDTPLFYIPGTEFGVPILAILVMVSTFFQSKLMTPPPTTSDQGAGMTKAMNMYMPLFMGYLAYSFSSGLALYFVTSNLVGILQYAAMGKLNWRNILPANLLPSKKTDQAKIIDQPKKATQPKKTETKTARKREK